jgi:hypothetical protein
MFRVRRRQVHRNDSSQNGFEGSAPTVAPAEPTPKATLKAGRLDAVINRPLASGP